MNYDRRYSPPANNNYHSRSQPHTPKSGPDGRASLYGREYPPLRSRSQTNVDQDDRYQHTYNNRNIDKSSRSKSLDNREIFLNDGYRDNYREQQFGATPGGGVIIPIQREASRARNIDVHASPYNRPREFDSQFERESDGFVNIPYNRDLVRETPRDRRGFEDTRRRDPYYGQEDSPRSYSSRFHDRRAIEYNPERYPEENVFDDYRTGGRSNFRTSHHRSHYDSHGGASGYEHSGARAITSGYENNAPRAVYEYNGPRAITQGPGYEHTSSRSHGAVIEQGGPRAVTQQPGFVSMHQGRPTRPIQHHRVKCCCLNFVWPPWSYETSQPPQQIYRNI